MSAGDHSDPFPVTVPEANKIIQLPVVNRMMRRQFTVNSRDWDIPYLAGYSQDAKTIYIDRDLKPWLYSGVRVTCNRFLILHEQVEKALIDAIHSGEDQSRLLTLLRMRFPDDAIYYHCHGVATAFEEYAVKLQYGASGLESYNAFMTTQVKRAEDERLRRVPANLDLTPYTSSEDAMDKRLLTVMQMRMAA